MKDLMENNQEIKVEKVEAYVAPSIEVIEVNVEQGFQATEPEKDEYSW